MPVSDLYLIQYLIQSTSEDAAPPLEWSEGESSEFRAELNGVKVTLFSAHATDGSRLCLKISRAGHRAFIEEPHNVGFVRAKYRGEEDRRLAEAIQLLAGMVTAQCARRRSEEWDLRDSIRQSLYRQLLFGS